MNLTDGRERAAKKRLGWRLRRSGRSGDWADVDGPAPPWLPGVRLRFELDLLAFVQFIERQVLQRTAVEEDFLRSAVRLNETEPSITDQALDSTYCHSEPPSYLLYAHSGKGASWNPLSLRIDGATWLNAHILPVGTLTAPAAPQWLARPPGLDAQTSLF